MRSPDPAADTALVLVVDDEPAQRALLSYNLEAAGFRVLTAQDGEEALLMIAEEAPDVILLDWMLPRVSGIEVCRQIRTRPEAQASAVIMVSARSEEGDLVRGLETGADDYITKPYSVTELLARVRANLRRVRPAQGGQVLAVGDLRLDAQAHRVHRGPRELHLGPTEFRLLAALMERAGRVWSREALLDRVWGRDIYVDSRTVDVHIGRLRKTLCAAGEHDPIRTIRGAGYAVEPAATPGPG
jgi:two-component system, OmpR family, phosphate regulon response regulator PhoB